MKLVRAFWSWLRAVSGDDAYERYLAHHTAVHPDRPVLDRRTFFKQRQAADWSQVRRCC